MRLAMLMAMAVEVEVAVEVEGRYMMEEDEVVVVIVEIEPREYDVLLRHTKFGRPRFWPGGLTDANVQTLYHAFFAFVILIHRRLLR